MGVLNQMGTTLGFPFKQREFSAMRRWIESIAFH
jgi:hypothetical protein